MIVYKIGEEQYPGRACIPIRCIDICEPEKHLTTAGWQSNKGIQDILLEIKKHKEQNYKNVECSVEYTESFSQKYRI